MRSAVDQADLSGEPSRHLGNDSLPAPRRAKLRLLTIYHHAAIAATHSIPWLSTGAVAAAGCACVVCWGCRGSWAAGNAWHIINLRPICRLGCCATSS
jgi:hypothetical protein